MASEPDRAADREVPSGARKMPGRDQKLLKSIRLWRAALNTPDTDLRPTGPTRHTPAERKEQRRLDQRLEAAQVGVREWIPRITETVPGLAGDPRLLVLAGQLATLDTSHSAAVRILHEAAGMGTLPDDHPADALGYRITNLANNQAERTSSREAYTPSNLTPHHEQPPSPGPPDRSPSISF